MRDAVDFVSAPDPAQLQQLGVDVLCYTGNARPSLDWVNDCRSRGITITFIQESYSTRSKEGFTAGVADCRFAEARAKEYGHAGSVAVVVSDGNGADNWDASDYGKGWASVATLPFFSYGAVPICESFNAGSGASLGTWVPETWGQGTLLSQVVGASPVPDTDLNHAHADYTGANMPAPVQQEDDDMPKILVAPGPYGNYAALVEGGLVLNDLDHLWVSDAQHPEGFGVPGHALAWNAAPGHGYDVKFIDGDMMTRLITNTKNTLSPPAEMTVKLTDAQLAKIGAGVSIDNDAVAKAVNDDAAARLAKV